MKKMILACALALASAGFGCAYGGVAVAQNGTVYVARNDSFLFGALRKVFVCKANGATLSSGGVEAVFAGGVTRSATILSGGGLYVSSGGAASATTINGSFDEILSGATASGTTVIGGGIDAVFAGGTTGHYGHQRRAV